MTDELSRLFSCVPFIGLVVVCTAILKYDQNSRRVLADVVKVAKSNKSLLDMLAVQGVVNIDYKNWRGERSKSKVRPISLRWGVSEDHIEPQFLLTAFDIDKQVQREFAVKDIHAWNRLDFFD